jgi:hypothetical protein
MDAFIAGNALALRATTSAGGKGPDADFVILDASRSEPLADAVTVKITAKATKTAADKRAPAWV